MSTSLVATLRELQRVSDPADTAFVDDLITDNLAIALAASGTSLARGVLASALAGIDGGSSSVIGADRLAPPAQAAFANSALAHMLDYDDIFDRGRLHPTTVVLPAALAAGQLVGASGTAVRDGVLLGGEVMCRFGVSIAPTATGPAAHWFITQLVGYVGAAVAAAVAMGLDDEGIVSAIGLSVMQAAGTKQPASSPGSTARAIYPAFAAAGGVTAALLAAGGMRGADDALDGPDGLLPLYLGLNTVGDEMFTETGWRYAQTSIKPWPCCRISHPYVAAALTLHRMLAADGTLDVDSITELRLDVNASAEKLCVPLEARLRPQTVQDAKYSIPFMTAHALVHGGVELESTGEECLTDPHVLSLAARVTIHDGLPDGPGHPPAIVTVTQHGDRKTAQADPAELDGNGSRARAKVIECLAFAGSADARSAADKLSRGVHELAGGGAEAVVDLVSSLSLND